MFYHARTAVQRHSHFTWTCSHPLQFNSRHVNVWWETHTYTHKTWLHLTLHTVFHSYISASLIILWKRLINPSPKWLYSNHSLANLALHHRTWKAHQAWVLSSIKISRYQTQRCCSEILLTWLIRQKQILASGHFKVMRTMTLVLTAH